MKKNHLEIEYKTLLTETEFTYLLDDFSEVKPVSQINYYIDTPELDMKKNRMSLRIRTFDEQAELTLKIPQEIGNHEYNQSLSFTEAQELIENFSLPDGEICQLIVQTSVPVQKLAVWGQLSTIRYEKETPIGLMALDENRYADQHDYELEVEVTDPDSGKIAFHDYLNSKGVRFKYASSKVARTANSLRPAQ